MITQQGDSMSSGQLNNFKSQKSSVESSPKDVLWDITKIVSKGAWIGTKFIIKNTPAALGMLWNMKKEIADNISSEMAKSNKAHKENLLENKLDAIKSKSFHTRRDSDFRNRVNVETSLWIPTKQ